MMTELKCFGVIYLFITDHAVFK